MTNFLIRSDRNRHLILTNDGEFIPDSLVGPGTRTSARLFKTRRGAERSVSVGYLVIPCDQYGVEQPSAPTRTTGS